ncbi:MAG: M20/M25/M40 family metallo-hydrolase, partial [Anaerolineae bacterium]|nr:M20/M25/M40 family metallo-hydrolase [Anaerolineae bacterium]
AAARGDLWQVGLAFDEERAFAWIKTLTGPPYLGRRAGSPQGHAAAEAIAQAFAEMGLQPAGPGGSYFQPFPVVHTWLAQVPSLVVTDATGQRHGYRFHQDFAPLVARYVGGGVGQGPVLWVGSCTHDDFDGVDAVGKVVFCREPPRREDAGRNALEHGAVGLLILTDPAERPLDRIGPYGETWVPMPLPALRVAPRVAEDLLAGSGLTLDDLTLQFAAVPLPSTAHLEIAVQVDEEAQGRNVLAVLPGRDLAHADEVVIVGAHYDHVGQDPDGTVWPGANDNASGTAALLEIARTWQKEGVVPRRTVLFAAWDAEELGLVGSRYYVEHPSYPLTQTVAMLNLDMVGAGEDILYVDGTGPVARHLAHLAGTLGITVTPTDGGRSDHSSFTEAGVPAAMPIWFGTEGGSDAVAHYHRPADTPAVIEPAKLAAAGRLANLTLLHLAEAEPAVLDLVRSRAEAAAQGDATSFLATSASWRAQEDRGWLEALSSLQPSDFALEVRDVIFGRDVATATVHMRVAYPGTDGREASRSATLPVRLERGGEGWRWAGPALVWQPPEEGIAVAFPPGREGAVEGLAPLAAAELRRVGELLHLPAPQRGAALLLYPDARALQADVAFAAPADAPSWVGTCTAPLGEGWGLATCARLEVGVLGSARPVLTDTLAQLALAQAGLREEMAPWLWHGLPPALGAQDAPLAVQPPYLEALAGGTGEGTDEASAWAAVEFARERVGWEGLGRLVRALAQGTPPEEAFHAVLGMGSADFEDAWRAHWRARLEEVQDGAAALFQARQQALQAGDLESFLRTVDRRDSLLEAAERRWFARWRPRGAEGLSLEAGQVLAFVDGGVVVQATLRHEPGGEGEEAFQATFPVLLRRQGEGYIWAGAPLATLEGGRARVLYPAGRSAQAQAFLAQAEAAIPQLASLLGREPPPSLTCILYDDGAAFRAAVAPGLPEEVEVWAEPGLVRLWLRPGAAEEDLAFALARGVAEALLWEAGLEQAWLRA